MKNYLLYVDCYTESRINECRYALLKYLSVYNLTPPANISVIVYTSRVAAFEIFLSFFKEMQVVESRPQKDKTDRLIPESPSSSYDGHLLICLPFCYIKKPIDDLFIKISQGYSVLYQSGNNKSPVSSKAGANSINTPVQSIPSKKLPAQKNSDVITAGAYFVNYGSVKEMADLLKIFFKKNEEESVPNLVKRVHYIDAEIIKKEALELARVPFLKKWFNRLTGKNPLVQRYQNKL